MTAFIGVLLASISMAPLAPAGAPAREARHSGRVLEVADGLLMMEETVTWLGPGTGSVIRKIRITPDTSLQLVRRADEVDAARWPIAFSEEPISVAEIRRGDHVTVTTRTRNGEVAVALEVYRPES
ncbi:MAG TPA: hypothetical protein VNN07_17315 [Candidatus Tectomicrobia bacterium]|nr:hypothetical protein [Candidatus Tectomicrobia bacterium]